MLVYKIGITLIPGIGSINGKKLIDYCGGIKAVFKEKKENLLKISGIGESSANSIINQDVLIRAEKEIKFIKKNNITPLFYLDSGYPNRLKHCIDSPLMLYYKGNADLNNDKTISVVGTRRATEYGKRVCNELVRGLANQNVLIVSGLAYGIDVCAHRAALDNNLNTVAVLAHGLDRIYPYVHKSIAKKMLDKGGLITEFLSETNPDKGNFPKRNRIIAGLSDAVIVVESAKRGGALITAEIANSYNRDVFAVPGKLADDKYSEGCNHLIKINKAALIESSKDIEYIMGWEEIKKTKLSKQYELFVKLSEEEKIVVNILKDNGESSIDWLCNKSQLNMGKVAAVLLNLEFQGIVRSLPGKLYRLD